MKYAIIIPDGCADEAQDSLGGVLVPEEINSDIVQRLPGLTVAASASGTK